MNSPNCDHLYSINDSRASKFALDCHSIKSSPSNLNVLLEAKVQDIHPTNPIRRGKTIHHQASSPKTREGDPTHKHQSPKLGRGSLRFFKLLNTDKFVKRFKNNLLQNSYILPKGRKKFLSELFIKQNRHQDEIDNTHQGFQPFPFNSWYLILWDTFMLIANFWVIWMTPFRESFDLYHKDISDVTEFFIASFFVLDILIHMNRTIIVQGLEVQSRSKIVKLYLQRHFFHDVTATILLYIIPIKLPPILQQIAIILLLIVVYIRLHHYFFNYFQTSYLKGNAQSNLVDLLTLITQVYFYNHIIACVFHYVAASTDHLGVTWIQKYNLVDDTPWVRYNYAFYWATMTMTTVGYGDVTASNQAELIYSSLIMLTSSCVFAYSMNSIGMILKELYDQNMKCKLMLISINRFMRKNGVDQNIQSRVRNYLQFYIDQVNRKNEEDVQTVIHQLPVSLKEELLDDIQMKIIKQIKIISNNFTLQTQIKLSKALEIVRVVPGDFIIKQGDFHNTHLYYLQSGAVQLLEERTQMKFLRLEKGRFFGFEAFLTGMSPKVSVQSVSLCEIYKIDRKMMLSIIRSDRRDFEKFHHLKDQILFNSNYTQVDLKCSYCLRSSHLEYDCPLLQYKPDIEQRIKKTMFKQSQNSRKNFVRENTEKHRTLKQLHYTQRLIKQHQEAQQDKLESVSSEEVINTQELQMSPMKVSLNLQRPAKSSTKMISDCNATQKADTKGGEVMTSVKSSFVIDMVCNFKYYLPHNNIKNQSCEGNFNRFIKLQRFAKYSFYYFVKLKAYLYRDRLDQILE